MTAPFIRKFSAITFSLHQEEIVTFGNSIFKQKGEGEGNEKEVEEEVEKRG